MYEMAGECTYLRQHIRELKSENERLSKRLKKYEQELIARRVVATLNTTTEADRNHFSAFMLKWLNRLIGADFEVVGCKDGGKHVYSYRERR